MTNPASIKQGKETRQKIVRFITDFMEANHYSPSYKEIMVGCGFNSLNTVQSALAQLEKESVIKRDPIIARSIVLLDPSAYLEEFQDANA